MTYFFLIVAILDETSINIGRIIERKICQCASRNAGELFFPSLITTMCQKAGVTTVNRGNLSYTTETITLHDICHFSPMPEGLVAPASSIVPDPDIKPVPIVSNISDFSFQPSDTEDSTDVSDLLTDFDHYSLISLMKKLLFRTLQMTTHCSMLFLGNQYKQGAFLLHLLLTTISLRSIILLMLSCLMLFPMFLNLHQHHLLLRPCHNLFLFHHHLLRMLLNNHRPAQPGDAALINILHTIYDQMRIYFQYTVARDQAMCYALQHPFPNLDHI